MSAATAPRFGRMIPAMVTPFDENLDLDLKQARALARRLVENGADALIINGTTGESPTVFYPQKMKLFEAVVSEIDGEVPVIANVGDNCTADTVDFARDVQKLGVDGFMLVVPYYNKPTQEGLFQHFSAVAREGGLPVILYNVPGRTGRDMTNDTVLRLAEVPGIVGLKDATGDLARAEALLAALPKDKDFALYSGNDDSALALVLAGGQGVISVTANVAPKLMHEMVEAALKGDIATARAINNRLLPLHKELFCESNPIPVKWALNRMGKIPAGIRLPLTWLTPAGQKKVEAALASAGLI